MKKLVNITQDSGSLVTITPGFLLLLTATAVLGGLRMTAATLLAAAVHEAGHLLAIRLLGGRIVSFGLYAGGAGIRFRGPLSYTGDAVAALSGPLAGAMLTGAALFFYGGAPGPFLSDLAAVSALYTLVNLIPASPLDGGRAVFALASVLFGPVRAETLSRILDILCCLAADAAGIWAIFCTGGNFSPLFFALFLHYSCCKAGIFGVK